jgi:GTP pyrophosphokinase
VPEDCGVSFEEMTERFGTGVAYLVEGVTKLKSIDFSSKADKQAENLRKLFLAMAGDVRVIIIKLADRLHNMRTLEPFPEAKRRSISEETLYIFAPIAHRLGIWRIKWELEDRAFKYLEPEVYKQIYNLVQQTRAQRSEQVKSATALLAQRLKSDGIEAEVVGRPKHFYSIYQKMVKQGLKFEAIHDLIALRVIVESVPDCYHALGVVHALWIQLPEMFFDYIAKPKPNNYQSLHTKVLEPGGQLLEVQIRTREMHREAEFGIAAHWRYKQGDQPEQNFGDKLRWIRLVLELQSETRGDAQGFLDSLRLDVATDQIFAFTPKGDAIYLPSNSTPIDFAFRVHSEVGNKCTSAKVNGRHVPLSFKLHNGDVCEIITSRASKGPKRGWLDFVVTPHARNRIKAFLRKEDFEVNYRYGLARLEKAARAERLQVGNIADNQSLDQCARSLGLKGAADLIASIGFGEHSAQNIVHRIRQELTEQPTVTTGVENISSAATTLLQKQVSPSEEDTAEGDLEFGRTRREIEIDPAKAQGMLFTLAKCCAPIPGDKVRGYVTRGRGITVHRSDCANLKSYALREPDRVLQAVWAPHTEKSYSTMLVVESTDRTGLLADITVLIAGRKINIAAANSYRLKGNRARLNLAVTVADTTQLKELINALRAVPGVIDVHRV